MCPPTLGGLFFDDAGRVLQKNSNFHKDIFIKIVLNAKTVMCILDMSIRGMGMRIYFDVCCLNRPFDDQTQDRIHMESESVVAILSHIENGYWTWVGSEVVNFEIEQIIDTDRRSKVALITSNMADCVSVEDSERS